MATVFKPSCVKCSKFLTCKDPSKVAVRGYSCVKFKRLQEISDISELDISHFVPKGEDEELLVRPKKTVLADQSKVNGKKSLADEIEVVDELPDNFVLDAMQRAYDPHTNMVRDLKIDDTDIPLAKNFYDFCANLVGKNIKMPFARQFWMVAMLMAEICPDCTNKKAFDMWNIPVDLDTHDLANSMVMLEHGVCPRCRKNKLHFLKTGQLNDYVELVLVGGQRLGKSTLTAVMVCYVIHRMLKSPKLSNITRGIQDFTPLTGSFVALSTTKAIKLLWNPIRDMISASGWFTSYFKMLGHYGKQYGKEFYQFNPTGTYLRVFHRSLDLMPEGPSKRTLRGPTRFISATDELGHFPYMESAGSDEELDDDRERANGDEVHQVLTNSLATMRTEVPTLYAKGIFCVPQGFNLSISSPASWKDKIMRLYAESKESKIVLGVKAATWEVSPMYTRDHPIIEDMYRRNPRKAERDFGANPPSLDSSVFNKERIAHLFQSQRLMAVNYVAHPERTRAQVVFVRERARIPPSVLTLDAGLVNNAFAITLSWLNDHGHVDAHCLEVVPRPGKKIDYPFLFDNIIVPIIKTQNVRFVTADRWNSEFMLQQLEADFVKKDLIARPYSLKVHDFENFAAVVDDGHLTLPSLELDVARIESVINYKEELPQFPSSHLYLQFLTVQIQNGMYYKGPSNTDDMLRSLVLATACHANPKVRTHLEQFKVVDRESYSMNAVVMVAGRSGGGMPMLPTGRMITHNPTRSNSDQVDLSRITLH